MKRLIIISIAQFLFINSVFLTFSSAQTIAAGGVSSAIICNDGRIAALGSNSWGVLGNGNNTSSQTLVSVSNLTGIIAVIAKQNQMLALKNDGTVWGWGNNTSGQLGTGTSIFLTNVPIQSAITGVIAISVGSDHTLALKNDGTVWAFGKNDKGQLGNGIFTTSRTLSPVQVLGLSGIIAIKAGFYHSLALKEDGTVWAWGLNNFGQLGIGNNVNSNVPIQVNGLTDVVSFAAGYLHSLAVKNDGSLWCWGSNSYGQLGTGNNDNSNIPVQINSLSEVTTVESNGFCSLVLKNDHTVWTFGYNSKGQLGNGNNIDSSIPLQILSDVNSIVAGYAHNFAIKNDGTIYSWGWNSYGQLGNGNTIDSNVPILINLTCPTLGISENEINGNTTTVFPNPFSSYATIEWETTVNNAELTIYNSYGQKCSTIQNITGQSVDVHRDNLSKGFYLFQLVQNNKVITKGKFMITD